MTIKLHGNFILLDKNNTFDMDVALGDQADNFTSDWSGKDLTKNGEGTLILSKENTYSGVTNVNGVRFL